MKAEILFYKTKQTEINRPLLERFLSRYSFSLERYSGASSPEQLAKRLGEAVLRSNLVLISGGLELDGKENIKNVLSAVLHLPLFQEQEGDFANAVLSGALLLENGKGGIPGAALRQGKQILLLLPDTSKDLEPVLDAAGRYLERQLGIIPHAENGEEKGIPMLREDTPEDILAIMEPAKMVNKKAGTGKRLLIAALGIVAVCLFFFLVYKIYLQT